MDKPTRLRFTKNKDGVYVSPAFLGNEGSLLTAQINAETLKVVVIAGDGTTIKTNRCESFSKCKVEAKEMLKTYGVTFFEETRNTKREKLDA